jgi:phasin family protein
MEQNFEQAGKLGKEFVDTSLLSYAALANGMQTIASEAADYSKKSFEANSKALEKMFSAKTPETVMEIHADHAKSAYEELVAQATRMSELYAEMAKEIYKPFEGVVAKAR